MGDGLVYQNNRSHIRITIYSSFVDTQFQLLHVYGLWFQHITNCLMDIFHIIENLIFFRNNPMLKSKFRPKKYLGAKFDSRYRIVLSRFPACWLAVEIEPWSYVPKLTLAYISQPLYLVNSIIEYEIRSQCVFIINEVISTLCHAYVTAYLFTNMRLHNDIISMAQCKTAVNPLLRHWGYCSLALSHR